MDAPAAPTELYQRIEASFLRQGLMQHLGARLIRVEAGLCEVALPYSERVTQQQGGFHGGAMGALADIAGGYAALTLVPSDTEVTTVEYKINFLAEVMHIDAGGKQSACALMQQTIVPVSKTY
jgi:uncharacterized protein (TIGR00369 family)